MAHSADPSVDRLLDDLGLIRTVADRMQALSSPSRLRILSRLHAGPASVTELAEAVGMEGSAVSHQLRLLRHLGLVVGQRNGRQVVYELHDDHVGAMLEQVVSHLDHVRLGFAGRRSAAEPVATAGPSL